MATTEERIDALIERQGWSHESQAMLFRRFVERNFRDEHLAQWLEEVAREENEDSEVIAALTMPEGPAPVDNRPAVPLGELQAIAVFLGWDPEEQGPVDEASDGALTMHCDHHAGWSKRRFRVNGEAEVVDALVFILANREDPCALLGAGALGVGETWGGGAGGDVVRLPDRLEEILLMDNGLAPEGWIEVQADDDGDGYAMNEDAAEALAPAEACLYRVATGEMALLSDKEASDALATRVHDATDGCPALISIVPRRIAVALFGEESVPR